LLPVFIFVFVLEVVLSSPGSRGRGSVYRSRWWQLAPAGTSARPASVPGVWPQVSGARRRSPWRFCESYLRMREGRSSCLPHDHCQAAAFRKCRFTPLPV